MGLLLAKPTYVPRTHRYRQISHEEFRLLSRFLDVYREYGKVIVVDGLSETIIPRVTGLPVSQEGWRYKSKFERADVPLGLGENDFVLVIFGKVRGTYIHVQYAEADNNKFRDWVETGIIEPIRYARLSGEVSETQLLVLAEKIGKNSARIANAKALVSDPDNHKNKESKSQLESLIDGFDKEIERDLKEAAISPSVLDALIIRVEATILQQKEQLERSSLLLEIESNLKRPEDRQTFGSVTILKGQVHAIKENLKQQQDALVNLGITRSYLARLARNNQGSDGSEREGTPVG